MREAWIAQARKRPSRWRPDHFATAALTDDAAIGIMSLLAEQTPEFTGS